MKEKLFLIMVIVLGSALLVMAAIPLGVTFGTGTDQDYTFTCSANGATLTAPYNITSGSANAVTVNVTLTNSAGTTIGTDSRTVGSGQSGSYPWDSLGNPKAYSGTFGWSGLPDGTYTLRVCASQNQGETCQNETVVISCGETSKCPGVSFYGEVAGNSSLGNGNGALQIQVRGDLGAYITGAVSGPTGFSRTFTVTENGGSCNYHANWAFRNDGGSGADLYGNAGAGNYSIYIWGAGNPGVGTTADADVTTTVTIVN